MCSTSLKSFCLSPADILFLLLCLLSTIVFPNPLTVPRSAPFGGLYYCAIPNPIVLITSCPNRPASRHSINIETFKIFMLKGLDALSIVEARPIPPPERLDAGVGRGVSWVSCRCHPRARARMRAGCMADYGRLLDFLIIYGRIRLLQHLSARTITEPPSTRYPHCRFSDICTP